LKRVVFDLASRGPGPCSAVFPKGRGLNSDPGPACASRPTGHRRDSLPARSDDIASSRRRRHEWRPRDDHAARGFTRAMLFSSGTHRCARALHSSGGCLTSLKSDPNYYQGRERVALALIFDFYRLPALEIRQIAGLCRTIKSAPPSRHGCIVASR